MRDLPHAAPHWKACFVEKPGVYATVKWTYSAAFNAYTMAGINRSAWRCSNGPGLVTCHGVEVPSNTTHCFDVACRLWSDQEFC